MIEKNEHNQILGTHVENWSAKQVPVGDKLQGNYCTIELLDVDNDSDELFAVFDGEMDNWTYLPYGPFRSPDTFRTWMRTTLAEKDMLYVIRDPKSNKIIGAAGYLRINPKHGSIEIGHLNFSKSLKKTPAATEAMYLMMRHVFDDLGYRRYEWKCNTLNEGSQRAAKRLGFNFEGVFRQSHVLKTRNRDTAWFSIIDSEWPDLKARFERWLDPKNFNSDGSQILSLNDI